MRLADPTLEATLFPDRWRVGHVPIRPMELGHALLLKRIGSPFAGPVLPAEIPWSEAMLAAWICSRGWAEAARGIDGFGVILWTRVVSWLWLRTRSEADVLAELRVWHASAWQSPEVEAEEDAKPLGSDLLHILLVQRRREFAESDAEALSVPLLRARLDLIVDAETRGVLRVVGAFNDEIEEHMASNRERFQEILRTGKVAA